ncbi:MAG TPA: hypothetical protein VK449_02925 [Anaerolineales bacterium]|nr:hypothetical protein [Anaerolineales bacterium]
MSNNTGLRIAGAVLLTLLIVGGVAALGYMAYSAGVAQGASQTGVQVVAPAAAAPMPYYGYPPYWFQPFGFLWCLAPFFFLFMLFFAMRLAFGGFGHRHGPWGWRGRWGSDEMREHLRQKADEWHKEQHGGGEAKA